MKLPRQYLSGFRAIMKEHGKRHKHFEKEWIRRGNVKYRCFSYAYVCEEGFYFQSKIKDMYDAAIEKGVGIMMDSSGFSFWAMLEKLSGKVSNSKAKTILDQKAIDKLRDETIENYMKFIKHDGKKWDFYANFDHIKNSETIWKMQLLFEKRGFHPAPIYHGDAPLSYLERYCDLGNKIVCIGGFPKARRSWADKMKFFDKVFAITEKAKVRVHGFAFNSLSMLTQQPWWSVDSATWAKAAAYGAVMLPDPTRNILGSVHVSERTSKTPGVSSYNAMNKDAQKAIVRQIEDNGFDFGLLRKNLYERCVYNAWVYNNLEKLIDLRFGRAQWENLI